MKFSTVCVGKSLKTILNRGLFLDQGIRCFSSFFAVQSLELSDEDENCRLSYAQLNSDVKGYASRGQIVSAMESLNKLRMFPGRPTVHEYNQLISCYIQSKKVASGTLMELYNVMKVYGPCPNFLTYEILLNGMASFGSSRDGVFMVEEMCRRGYRPLFRSLSGLLEKSLELSILDSLSLLNLMLRFNYYPVPFTAKRFIVRLCESRMFREAHFLFSLLLEKNHNYFQVACNYSHNQILWALCKCGQLSNALAFFGSLEKKGVVHNESSYTALIYGFCGARLLEDTFRCLDLMEIVGCKPNLKTYTVVVKFLCDVGKIKEALSLLNRMTKEGCFPDLVTFNILLRELCHQEMLGMMYALLEHINQKGFSPNQFTYASLAGGLLRKGYVPLAKNLLHGSMSIESVTDTAIYNIYLHALCCEHKTEEALSLVNNLISKGFTPTNISYNTILKGICEEKSIGECLKFFDHIRRSGNNPDLVSYNTMLSAACKQRKTSIINRLLCQMDYEGFKFNITGATSLLLYYCKARKFSECLKLLESMMTNGPNPTILTFNALIRRLCKMQALNMADRIFNFLKSFGLSPDTTTYIILIHAYKKVGNQLMVSQLLTDMFSQQVMLLHVSHFLLDLQGSHNIRYLL